jgi:hypothetical protein
MTSTHTNSQAHRGRRQLVLLALIFALPVLLATLLNSKLFQYRPSATRNYGELLQPVIALADLGFAETGAESGQGRGRWTLYWHPERAGACATALELLKRVRAAEGRHFDRIAISSGSTCTDSNLPDIERKATEHTTILVQRLPGHGLFLIDPLGNAMMRYPESFDPKKMQKDLDRLLRYSKVGKA